MDATRYRNVERKASTHAEGHSEIERFMRVMSCKSYMSELEQQMIYHYLCYVLLKLQVNLAKNAVGDFVTIPNRDDG